MRVFGVQKYVKFDKRRKKPDFISEGFYFGQSVLNFCKLFVNLQILRNLTKIIIQINMVRHLFAKTASGITAAAVLFVLPQSCVNEEYSLDKELDLTVSFGGDALVFPLGSTEQLTLKTLLSEEDFSYLTSQDSENGEYRFSITPEDGEQIDLSDEIPDLAEELNIAIETVKKHKQIARRLLKEKIGRLYLFLF